MTLYLPMDAKSWFLLGPPATFPWWLPPILSSASSADPIESSVSWPTNPSILERERYPGDFGE